MPDISRYLKKAKQMDAENGVVYTATPPTSANRSTYTPSQSGPDISSYLEKARAMDGGGYGTAPTVTADRRRISDVPGDYDVNIGKSGWQKYLADQERKRSEAMAAQKEKSFWEKLAGYLGEVQDTTMSLSGMPSIIEDYREDTSYLQPNDEWMDEERYVFGYLYDTDRTAAYQYADKVNAAINAEKEAAQAQKVMDSATNGFWGGAANTVGSILTAPLGLADYLDDLAQTSARGEIRDNGVMSPFEYSQNVTVGISQDLNEKYGTLNENIPVIGGKGWGDVYGLGTSIAQSALAGYTGGGGQALVQFFGSAAAASVDDALSRGATAEQAAIVGTASGVAEGLMENIGVENLLKIGSSATMRELVINLAKQGAIESLEEGGTSLLNNIADQLVMQDKSNFFILAKNYMDNGWSEEEAKRQAWLDMAEDIAYDMLGGFVSGAVHAGPQTVYHTISQNAQAKNTYGDSTHELVAEGLASAEGSLSRTLAEKYQAKLNSGGKLTGAEIHRLVIANEQQFYSEDMDAIKQAAENRLVELGEFEKASDVAAVLAKLAAKQKLTAADKAIVQNSKYGQQVANEMNPSNIRSGGFESGWAKSIGTNTINYAEYNADLMSLAGDVAGVSTSSPVSASKESAPTAGSLTPAAVAPATERFTASESGKLTNKKTGADLGKVEITSSDGKSLKLKTESGEIVDAKDVDFRSKDEAMVYSAVLDMGVSPVVAQSIVDNFDGTDGRVYAADVKLAYQYGKMNFPKSYLDKLDIKPHQAEHAYNLGRSDAKAEAVAPKTKRTVKGKRGTVIFETAVDESTMTPIQRQSLNGIKAIADLSGLNVHVFESRLTKDGYKFTLPDGTVTGANGWYVTGTNDIWIDMNAGNAGEGTMLYTAAHEISHFIKEWSPTKWRVLADFLMEQYGEDVPLYALLERQMAKVRKNNPDLQGNALMDAAYEELVCDAMSEMLVDGEVVKKLAELKQKDKTLWEKIKDAIRDLLEKWGMIRKEYEGRSVAGEAEFLRGMDEAFKKLQQLYTEAFAAASENYQADQTLAEAGIAVNAKTDSGSLFSVRDVLSETDRKKVAKALAERFAVTEVEAMEWLKAETSLASLILNPKYSAYLDYEGDPDEVAIKKNSDYPQGTVDFSNICKKRREFTQVMNRVLRNFPHHVFAATDLAKIRTIMGQEGMTLPCGICYVEDRRQLDSIVAQDFINGLKLYREGSKTRPDGKPFNANQLKGLQMTDGDTYVPSIYELVTLEGRNSLKAKNPNMEAAWVRYNNARGMQSVRLLTNEAEYKRQILKYSPDTVRSKNDLGGLRIYSFSDMEMFHLIDIVQVITDSATVGLSLQGYTKVNEYARAVKDTGEKLNRSLIPAGDLGYHIEDGKVVLDYDTVEGIDIHHEDFFDNRDNPNVGNIVIGINDTQIRAAMVSDFIDQIIPFHTGQSEDVLGEKGIAAWNNYKDFQTEKDLATGKTAAHQINIYTEVIQAAEQEGKPIQNKRQFVEKFLAVCKQHGLKPRFAQFLNTDANGDYIYTEGYHKFLVDFKTFAQTEVGEYLPQMPVKPIFDNAYMTGLLKAYVTEQQTKDAEVAKQMPRVIERITNEIIKSGEMKRSERDAEATGQYADGVKFSERVTDKDTLKFLNGQKTITTYKTMQLVDGKLYPPMAARTEGKYEDYSILGQWEQATEHPELITDGNQYKLDKGKGQGSLKAAYNPYMHSSNLVLNDQFSGAYSRPQLVTVECEVPVSELTSGYHAQYAKDSVGWHAWHTGTVAGQLRKARGIERQVFLSRWIKPVRIVPDSEVAGMYKDLLDGTDIAVPDNVVTPSLLAELKKAGVKTKESGKFKMSEQDNPYHGKSMYRNAEVYDYDFMVSLQPMEVHTMPSLASVKTGDRVDQKKAVSLGLKNAEEVGRVAENGSYAITNVYTGREIHLGQHGLEHSLGGNDVARIRTNARLSAIGGLIVQNAVPINGLTNKNRQANGTYALACLLKSGNRYVVAIVTVEEHSSTAVDIDYVDISHSISGRLVKNKEDSRSSTRETGYVLSEAPATTAFKVSIADFLEIVNETYRSILSADVLKHFVAERPADGYYSDRVLYSDRDSDGHQLSKEQREFFNDSKVRDADGNLMVMYHGTANGGAFTVFDGDKLGNETRTTQMGQGFYFTNVKKEAEAYTKNVDIYGRASAGSSPHLHRVYLNITNPFNVTTDTIDIGAAKSVYMDGTYEYFFNEWIPFYMNRKSLNGRMFTKADVQAMSKAERVSVYVDYLSQLGTKAVLSNMVRAFPYGKQGGLLASMQSRLGYDGLVEEFKPGQFQYVAFAPEQVKATDNINPTANPDIRYSDRDSAYQSEEDINRLRNEIEEIDDEMLFAEGSEEVALRNKRVKLQYQLDKLLDAERRAAKPTSLQTVLDNLKKYRRGDLESIANQLTDGAWDEIDDLPTDALIDGIREVIKGRGLSPLEMQVAKFGVYARDVSNWKYSDRDIDSVSNRDILANAFMDIAQNDVERGKIAEYQQKIKALDEDERKLRDIRAQLHDLSFSAGPRDNAKIRELREKATKLANRIGIQDKQLLRLEASKPLMAVLEREKKLAYSRASQKWEDRIETARTGRSKTEMRHKIKKIVGELNNLLLHGTKDKHIMIGLQKATAEALSAINMDTVDAEKRLAKIQAKIDKATDPAEKARLQQSYARVEAMGDNMATRLTALKNAYEEIKDSGDPLVANAYQPEIEERIKNLRKMVGDTPLRNMSMEQLEFTYDTYKMVLTTIRNANKAFKNERGESIAVLGNRSMEEIGRVGGKKEIVASAMRGPLGFAWSGMKPTYAFKAIGSDTLSEMFSQVRAGEDVWATDVNEAKEFYSQKTKQYHYDSWDLEKEYTFTSKSGKEFKLTLEQIMSLYAYSKRKQADAHLEKGGFVFDSSIEVVKRSKLGIPVKYRVNTAHAHALSRDTLMEICKTLTDEQVKFVDEMQDYLSTVMGEKGNEVSLKMYGVKLFKEKFYFPLKSAKQFMYEQYEVAGDRKIKNSGFSKDTTPHASNPVILNNFTDVWATHVNDMAMYHAFVLPMEDFERVFNYKTPTSDTMPTESVKGYLQDAYGVHPEQYIKQLMTDLNGGARIDPTAGIINKGIALFKKSAVFASLSVVIQQPSAIARAMAYIDAKYFVGKPGLKDWDEVKKYAPVAIIKEMGYFDTNMGKSTVEFIKAKEYTGVKSKMKALVTDRQYRDEILSKAPSVADELAWCQIWNAVKKEIAETKKLQGEELLQAAGKRFTEVIVNTQVYDSVLTRSGMMRSKDTGMKMATSFMAEPTTSLNMIADALIQGKRGNKGYARKAIGAVAASMILNSILVSFVYAGRDDDEDKTYIEKYAGSLTSELIDSFNPLTLIPFVKDIVSIAQGYDVERSDMAVITDLFNAWKKLSSDNLSVYRKVEGFGGTIASIFGLPLKNIMRDVRGIYNTVKSAVAGPDTTGRGVLDAARESLPKWMGGGERSNADQLYAAMLSGDTGHVERLKARFKDDRAFTYAVRDGLVNNDKRITAAAEARAAGNQTEYMRLAREIVNEGHFSQDDVVRAVNYVLNSLTKKESDPAEATKPDTFKIDEYLSEALSGDQAEAELVKREIIAGHVADGKTEDEALKSFNNSFKNTAVKGAFTDGDITMDVAIAMLQQYGGVEPDDAYADVQYWQFKQNHPDIYVVDSWFDSYYEYASDAGIGIDMYMQYRNDVKNITGENKKERRMAAINALPLSPAQKDALYFDEGWVASKLHEAPWR